MENVPMKILIIPGILKIVQQCTFMYLSKSYLRRDETVFKLIQIYGGQSNYVPFHNWPVVCCFKLPMKMPFLF